MWTNDSTDATELLRKRGRQENDFHLLPVGRGRVFKVAFVKTAANNDKFN
jgi:hypothetical protein